MFYLKNPKKKALGILGALIIVVFLLPLFAAFEAHVINVKAHIENALEVSPQHIDFGTVFPQEALEATFTVALSESFMDTSQTRVKDVEYEIVQELKPIPGTSPGVTYKDLRPFVDKSKDGTETDWDSESSATLDKSLGDIADNWLIRLFVPCIQNSECKGHSTTACPTYPCGTDPLSLFPVGTPCASIPEDPVGSGTAGDYGLDIWIEVTGLSYPVDQLIDVDYSSTVIGPGPLSATEVQLGDTLRDFPGLRPRPPFTRYLLMRDSDGSLSWTDGDFLMWDIAPRTGAYALNDIKVRGDYPWVVGASFGYNLHSPGVATSLNVRYHDTDGNNFWNTGEDIVSDVNGNGIYD